MIKKILTSPSRRFVLACGIFLVVMGAHVFVREQNVDERAAQYIVKTGQVDADVFVRDDAQELIIALSSNEHVKLRVPAYPQFMYGDQVHVACNGKMPNRYERMRGIDWVCKQVQVTVIGHGEVALSKNVLYAARSYVRDAVQKIWPEPHASLLAGILYGERTQLPKTLTEQFRIVGLTHIVAVSGYNITIIAAVCMVLLRIVGIRRKRAFLIVCSFVALFVLFVGSSASAVRAGIMGIVALLGKTIGRGSHAAPVLAATAVVMTVYEPMTLLYDAGFHLSMLATMGLIYVSPVLQRHLTWIPERLGMRELLCTSLAAMLSTAPFISWQFGTVSLIGLAANVLVVPIVPFIMASGAAALVVGLVHVRAGIVVGSIAWLLTTYALYMAAFLSKLPHAMAQFQIHFFVMVAVYTGGIIWLYREHKVLQSLH